MHIERYQDSVRSDNHMKFESVSATLHQEGKTNSA